jgi:hypothetical protein
MEDRQAKSVPAAYNNPEHPSFDYRLEFQPLPSRFDPRVGGNLPLPPPKPCLSLDDLAFEAGKIIRVGGNLPLPPPKPCLSLDDLAFEAWKIILTRDYCGKHRDSPADAAQIAYEYAEAFVARRGQG